MITLGNAQITFDYEEGHDYDMVGNGCWTVQVADMDRLDGYGLDDDGSIVSEAWDAYQEAKEDGDDTFYVTTADAMIIIMEAMSVEGGEFSLYWEGDNAFWCYHDMIHATHHTSGGVQYINGWAEEEQAHILGAELAQQDGFPLGRVMRALGDAEKDQDERFPGCPLPYEEISENWLATEAAA